MSLAWLEEAARLQQRGQSFVLATVVAREAPQSVRPGAKAIILPGGGMVGWIGGGCVRPTVIREGLAVIGDGRPRLVRINPGAEPDCREGVRVFAMTCQGEGAVDIYLEPVLPRRDLFILGRTPVAEALARLAAPLDLRVRVADPLAAPDRFPGAAEVLVDYDAVGRAVGAFAVVATQGEGDEEALEAALASDATYIGLVASRRKAASLFAFLRARGIDDGRLARVRCPAGLDLGAVTPAEIALSILAEIVGIRRGAAGGGAGASASAGTMATGAPLGPPGRAAPGAPADPPGATDADPTQTDPVCGMAVEVRAARHVLTYEERTYYFCCPHCKARFERDPGRYLAPAGG